MNFEKEKFVIKENSSIKQALEKIDQNNHGMIFLSSTVSKKIIGLATDGDIRRALLKGVTINDLISECANKNFVWAKQDTPRENLIKKLDGEVDFIPILNDKMELQSLVTKDYLPIPKEEEIFIRSRAPVRVSFGGGGSDVTHFFAGDKGAVINSTISLYSHATLRVRSDSKILIHSLDLKERFEAKNLEKAIKSEGPFGLILAILKVIRPKFGFNLYLNSDFPLSSGLGGSATISAAVLGCFNMLRKDRWDRYEIAEIAFQAERLYLGIAGGWQDQYASVFGGFNFLEFNQNENVVNPIRIQAETLFELEESLVLCDTGISHDSGNIHIDQKIKTSSKEIKKKVLENVQLTYDIRNYLLRGQLTKFGKALNETWQLKRKFSDMITNDHIDMIYNGAIENGALGGKLLGAGGGGFFIFYVSPFDKHKLIQYLENMNLTIQPFRFESEGLRSTSSRFDDFLDPKEEVTI